MLNETWMESHFTENSQNVVIKPGEAFMLTVENGLCMGRTIGYVFQKDESEKIVGAVNAHNELLGLLRRAQVCCETAKGDSARALVHEIRATLSKFQK